jgi:ABC-type multidrug transport system ATPase subunit
MSTDVELTFTGPDVADNNQSATDQATVMPRVKSLRFASDKSRFEECNVIWRDLNKFVDTQDASGAVTKKQILYEVSGYARPGEVVALMGPSGSGKTTLLNVIGGRAMKNMDGDIFVNGKKYSKSMRKKIAYVMQEDIFFMNLTVREQLTFTCQLRLPESVSAEEKMMAVDHVIDTLAIRKCENTQIMLVSGGEKKRCNIGTELLTNPSVMLLDEPTSGVLCAIDIVMWHV